MIGSRPLVAVIEDEAPIRRFLKASLEVEDFAVAEASDGREGLRIITQQAPAIILLDLGLPDLDGVEIIRQTREWSMVPIIVISARGEEASKVAALDAGADDYLSKPFSVAELLARIRASMRRAARPLLKDADDKPLLLGNLAIDLPGRKVSKAGQEIRLTKIEFDLLSILARNLGRVISHHQLIREVWGPRAPHEPHHVRVFMATIRKKIEDNPSQPQYLVTEQGVGYRLRDLRADAGGQ
jgi:two-component system, OmpR family, KDP operon response regulator KdpE